MSHFKGTVCPFLSEILKLRDERVNGVPRPPCGRRAVMVGYMWSESACVTTPRKKDGRSFSVWSPLRFTHPAAAAAGEQRRLLTRRRRLQILSMLRIRSLCGHKDNVWWTVSSFSSLIVSSSCQYMIIKYIHPLKYGDTGLEYIKNHCKTPSCWIFIWYKML